MADDLRESALEYHRLPRPGKLTIQATKPMACQRDLSLAYSPSVAARSIADLDAYTPSISKLVYRSGNGMEPEAEAQIDS